MKEKILEMYFDKNMRTKDVATKLGVSSAYITKVVKVDSRYIDEKETRRKKGIEKHKEDTRKIQKRQSMKIAEKRNIDDLILKEIHRQDSMELSKHKTLSDEAYRKWNTSAYKYNNDKERFEFREELGRSYDVKKYLKWKI